MKFVILLATGLFLGLQHALEADHVAAVSTLVAQTGDTKKSSILGAFWGLGHSTALFLAGFTILGLKIAVPEKLVLSFEFLVGLVLIALGADVMRKIRKQKIHIHEHVHDDTVHAHFHSHEASDTHDHRHRSFLVGMVHGLAGSGALVLLALTTAQNTWQGLGFILIFGAGSVVGMMLMSMAISVPVRFAAEYRRLANLVAVLAGSASIIVGIATLYDIGFIKHLFF